MADVEPSSMRKKAVECARYARKHESCIVVSHIDADGLTSGAITLTSLQRAGLSSQIRFLKQLRSQDLEQLMDEGHELVVFTDLGSGLIDNIEQLKLNAIVIDHHQPAPSRYGYQLNAHLFGIDGSYKACGASTAYLFARALSREPEGNIDLSPLAIVGAVGDMQHMKTGRLTSLNRAVLKQGSAHGYLSFGNDLKLYGKQTRPLFKQLEYCTDPVLPALTGNEDACVAFLHGCDIRARGERWRRWIDLDDEEKQSVVSALIQHCLASGMPPRRATSIVGEVYTLLKEQEGTELRDASEFATLLNATARYDRADVGLAVCQGDRAEGLKRARTLLSEHRKNLAEGLKLVSEVGATKMQSFTYFDAGGHIRDTIVGIVAGMSMSFLGNGVPVVGFAESEDGMLKVSARTTAQGVRAGINLANALSAAAEAVGGSGGGHNVAAGASIPNDRKDLFLQYLEKELLAQGASR
ncbi:MAG: DHHA1 domain-containing protein [Methermicoccaceae archaeon]